MPVHGSDCTIAVKTANREMDIPYSTETIREAVSILQEEAPIEGNGICRGLRKHNGVTGCVVTPLTIGTAPLLLYLAMGSSEDPVFVSQTRSLYLFFLGLASLEDSEYFSLIQDRGGEREIYSGCGIKSFELRINRDEAVKLKLDIFGEGIPAVYHPAIFFEKVQEERFNGDFAEYKINGRDYKNIYGLTLSVKKENGTKTELLVKRVLEKGVDLPEVIDEVVITARLIRDKYEYGHLGTFRIMLYKLFLVSDETEIETADTVIGPLRYHAAGSVFAEVFAQDNGGLA